MAMFDPRPCDECGLPETIGNPVVEIPGNLETVVVHESCLLGIDDDA